MFKLLHRNISLGEHFHTAAVLLQNDDVCYKKKQIFSSPCEGLSKITKIELMLQVTVTICH